MIDLILITAFGGVFYAGFKVGNRYKTIKEAANALIDALRK